MSRSAPVILLLILLTACGGQASNSQASPSAAGQSPSPSASPSPSPTPPAAAFAVLVTAPTSATYRVSLIGADGQVAATAQASGFNGSLTCAGVASAVLPLPVSTSNSRAYFMDGAGVVHWLDPQGQSGTITTLPHSNGVRSMFSVSPDNKQMSVVVSTFTATTAHSTLYLYDLVAGRAKTVFSQTATSGLWPIGWHGGSLVLGKAPACSTSSAFGCCGPTELHVVDPSTAVRRFTIGGPACIVSGPSTPVGTPCLTSANVARVLDWAGVTLRTVQLPFKRLTYLSPDGQHLAYQTDGGTVVGGQTGPLQMGVCGWIDNTHIVDPGHVGDLTTSNVIQITTTADCAGRIPGGL